MFVSTNFIVFSRPSWKEISGCHFIRSAAFFIPSAIGVQELAFVIVGELVGYSSIVSFSVAIGRRLREIMVGIPAIITWIIIFRKQSNHFN